MGQGKTLTSRSPRTPTLTSADHLAAPLGALEALERRSGPWRTAKSLVRLTK